MILLPRKTTLLIWSLFSIEVACVILFWPMLTREPLKVLRPGGLPPSVDVGSTSSNMHLVGYTETQILTQYGPPTESWDGHYHRPHWRWWRKYPDEISCSYIRPTGTLFISYIRQDGILTCSCSIWLPTGWGL